MMRRMQSGFLAVRIDPSTEEIARRAVDHAGAEIDVATTADEALVHLRRRRYRVVLSHRDTIDALAPALSMLSPRPVVIVVGDERESLDADLVTLVVPSAYDPQTLVGVVLACLNPARFPLAPNQREGIDVC